MRAKATHTSIYRNTLTHSLSHPPAINIYYINKTFNLREFLNKALDRQNLITKNTKGRRRYKKIRQRD